MSGKIIVDEIEKSAEGTGIKLNSPLLNSTGTEIMSAAGALSGNVTFPSTIDNTTLGSNVTFPAGHVIQTVYAENNGNQDTYASNSRITELSYYITVKSATSFIIAQFQSNPLTVDYVYINAIWSDDNWSSTNTLYQLGRQTSAAYNIPITQTFIHNHGHNAGETLYYALGTGTVSNIFKPTNSSKAIIILQEIQG